MAKYRLVLEEELLQILKAYNKFLALESAGVNNWEWYGEAIWYYLDDFLKEQNLDPDDDWNYGDIAKMNIKKFPSMEFYNELSQM